MELDGRNIKDNETLQTDICIIGAGTAGITLAHAFINDGYDLLLLESGGLKPDKQSQMLSLGENVGHPYFPLDTARPRGLGGSTNRWFLAIGENEFGARMRPLDSIDFEKREEIPYSGWPFNKKELDPYYKRAEDFCRITPSGFHLEDWFDPEKTPPFGLNPELIETVIFKFASREPFIKEYAGDLRKSEKIKIVFYTTALGIETDESVKNIISVQAACFGGNKFRVAAKLYVLACGGIENARLLLLSNKQQKEGIGNQHDLVGRFFMEHLHFHSGLFIPDDPFLFQRAALYNTVHKVKGVPILGKLTLAEHMLRKEKLANYVTHIKPLIVPYSRVLRYFYPAKESKGVESFLMLRNSLLHGKIPAKAGKLVMDIVTNANDIFLTVFRNLKRKVLGHLFRKKINVYTLHHMSEQVPNPESRVTLAQQDVFGQNRVRRNWQFSPIDISSAVRSQEILAGELKKAGIGQLFVKMKNELNPHPLYGGWHHMGTTRMNDDPKQGVVDSNCRVHGLSNLYVAGPSVFPTGGYANPSLTIVALTLRLSDHIKKQLGV
jgi:choline dehydrogenase-like flavoprotein